MKVVIDVCMLYDVVGPVLPWDTSGLLRCLAVES